MASPRIRVGIDVGGTFTDAVAIDAETLELLGQAKVATTHNDPDGVARGVVLALEQLLDAVGCTPADVGFLAHGTTQATNALLEGDVATVGIVGVGRGVGGRRTAQLIKLGPIELAPGRFLPLHTAYAPMTGNVGNLANVRAAVTEVRQAGAEVVVGAEAYSVDDPTHELEITDEACRQGLLATGTHEITKLYGLRRRTRTAVVNACILPRMLATADVVATSVAKAGITSQLMVMRCDGGVMSLDEMRHRPLLTILSGPAAGVAGALMSERVSDGVFLETGGTSTDISVIKEGRVAVQYAQIGGHETFLSSLDVRTVGIGGGSMIRAAGGRLIDVGPRSAHIGGFDYCCYADPAALGHARLASIPPMVGDPADYLLVEGSGGRFALTVTCAANFLGLVPRGDYAYVDPQAARLGFELLGKDLGLSPEAAAEAVLAIANARVVEVVDSLIEQYDLDRAALVLVGGGGGAATVTPHLGRVMGLANRIAAHNEVISPVGVALAMIRESVERIIPNASQQDVLGVRAEAERTVLAQGAAPGSVEIDVEIDPRRNIVRAVATGATELRTRDLREGEVDDSAAVAAAARALRAPEDALRLVGATGHFRVFGGSVRRSSLFGLLGSHAGVVAVVDRDGAVVFHSRDAYWQETNVGDARAGIERMLADHTNYGSGAPRVPAMRLVLAGRLVNLAGLVRPDQVVSLAESDLSRRAADESAVLIAEAL
jgi:N-methylhydantoinase A/oxoprolinase/acetone carboxylase beta subunit